MLCIGFDDFASDVLLAVRAPLVSPCPNSCDSSERPTSRASFNFRTSKVAPEFPKDLDVKAELEGSDIVSHSGEHQLEGGRLSRAVSGGSTHEVGEQRTPCFQTLENQRRFASVFDMPGVSAYV